MAQQDYVPSSWTTFRMFAQIFVAFGEGAGQLPVSDDAVRAAVADYARRVEEASDWEGSTAPVVLGMARVMGQAAAEFALRSGRLVITAEDYEAARAAIHRSSGESLRLMSGCPWPAIR